MTALSLLSLLSLPAPAAAQTGGTGSSPWALRLRAVISGDSHDSEPVGYKIYSGLALEAAVVRHVSDVASLELSLRAESR
ncbi:MAG TPA: hypothetical protein VJ997_10095, partial [Longimicrobiales bacterium]|nr:hypothetical protein [Longimicrobiales bacterium]